MAKKIYALINEDINEVVCASEDKDFIREVMCDCFMDDLMYEWYWYLINIRYFSDELSQVAKMTWENTLEWYDDFMHIQVIEVV